MCVNQCVQDTLDLVTDYFTAKFPDDETMTRVIAMLDIIVVANNELLLTNLMKHIQPWLIKNNFFNDYNLN